MQVSNTEIQIIDQIVSTELQTETAIASSPVRFTDLQFAGGGEVTATW